MKNLLFGLVAILVLSGCGAGPPAVSGSYVPTIWRDDGPEAPDETNHNKIETGIDTVHKLRKFSSEYASLNAAKTDIGATECTLVINSTIALTADMTGDNAIPSTLSLVVIKGGLINHGTYDLTINGPFPNLGLIQCFSGAGDVTFGSGAVNFISILWFGANPNAADVSATTLAIQQAINAAISSYRGAYTLDSREYTPTVLLPGGKYLIDAGLIIPECMGFSLIGEEGSFVNKTTIQWAGAETDGYMIDARSVLGFGFKNITLIGQSDMSVDGSPCISNGIISGRYDSGLFNSTNVWEEVKVIRFPGTGVTFGRYVGYNGATYPPDTGQTDNSYFRNLVIKDCKIGLVINSINFLQCHFSRLSIGSYGGNPVDGDRHPIEDPNAAPIKFRTKNAIRLLYGEFSGTAIHIYAPFADADPESQYALYCLDGSFNIFSGYSENRFLVYVANGANGTGGTGAINTNTIQNFHLYSGAVGGPQTAGKYKIYYSQSKVPLTLVGCKGIRVIETSDSAGVRSFGCFTEACTISQTSSGVRNRNSSDIAISTMAYNEGEARYDLNNIFGHWGNFTTPSNGQILLSNNLVKQTLAIGDRYLFRDGDGSNTTASGIIIDSNGVRSFEAVGLTNGATYPLSRFLDATEKFYPVLQGSWTYGDATRRAGFRYFADRRAVQLFGTVTGGTGLILYLPVRPSVSYRVATVSNGAFCELTIGTSGQVYLQSGSATNVSLDGIVLLMD